MSSLPGALAIRPMGRIRFGVCSPQGVWLVTATQLYDSLDPVPELLRAPEFLGSPVVRDPYAVGNPIYEAFLDRDPNRDRLVVTCVLKPDVSASHHDRLRMTISRRLYEESPGLLSGANGQAVQVHVQFAGKVAQPFAV